MSVTGSRLGEEEGEIRRGRSRVRVRTVRVSELLYSHKRVLRCLELERRRKWHALLTVSLPL